MNLPASLNIGPSAKRLQPNRWDLVAFPLVIGLLVLLSWGARHMTAPLELAQQEEIKLDPEYLPYYALRTTLRMLLAIAASLLFTLVYATLAAKSRRAELILIPILDILQSVPVLGYISFTVTAFLALFPGSLLGAEMAAVFAIFTSQAWNMTFSLYQSLRTVPRDLDEASNVFQLSGWQKFWRLELPYAMPGLVWNTMMSMSGGWFFVVASEAISVSDKQIFLPGIGSYIALALKTRSLSADIYAVGAMLVVILLYDQLLFRPLVVWADKFKFEDTASQLVPHSWLHELFRRTRLLRVLSDPIGDLMRLGRNVRLPFQPSMGSQTVRALSSPWIDRAWYLLLVCFAGYAAFQIFGFVTTEIGLTEFLHVLKLGLYTLIRVVVLIAIAAVVWVPIGVMIGLRPALAEKVQPIAQFLAAFPSNLLFPIFVSVIVRYHLNTDIWLSPLMILGTQWYILFNVIAGTTAFPSDLREAADSFGLKGLLWWRKVILPGIFPYLLTGALTASGGSWNASIVAEAVSWGDTSLTAVGLGSYITEWTTKGDFPRIVLGIAVMSLFVTLFNRLLWRPLYAMAERRLRLG
jgi:NitT/TauT family transport system permease protein